MVLIQGADFNMSFCYHGNVRKNEGMRENKEIL